MKTYEDEEIQRMLDEADALLMQTDPEIIKYMEEERRIRVEEQAEALKKYKSQVQDRIGKKDPAHDISHGEGVHEAMEDIAKAMKSLADYMS